jgi:hypothetical protein
MHTWKPIFIAAALVAAFAVAAVTALAQPTLDRTQLPIPEPVPPAITEVDARKATPPPRFEVKAPANAPNVLIVLIDDMGFGQSSAFGGPIHMPTVERLASNGLRYNHFHTTALCSPTRAALLTGRNHHVNNSFRGASAYALGKGLQSIGAEDNSIVIFSELMDAKSLFLTANADTVYYLGVVNLEKGPMVLEQPPKGLGTINDMWFSWSIDIGFPGPDRGEGGKYLLVPPGYAGPLPEGGFFIARSRTVRVLYAARAFLTNNDPKPTVENIKKHLKIYPYTPGGYGTSIATALEGKVRLGRNPAIPETTFVEGTGKAFNTIPPGDYGFFEMINENVQQEREPGDV